MKNTLKIKNLVLNSVVIAAPLAGITDIVYRKILREFNKEALLYTEMISSEAVQQNQEQRITELSELDAPIAFQMAGHKPEVMARCTDIIQHMADLIDINMGCPTPKIVKNGDGSALMRTPELASKIVKEVKKHTDKPLSVKFRLGWDHNSVNCIDFARLMEDSGADMVIVHGRTRSQFYSGQANWDYIAQIKDILEIPVIANGDIFSPELAKKCIDHTNCDGIALARGLLGDPWLLNRVDCYLKTGELLPEPTIVERLDMAQKHCEMLMAYMGDKYGLRHCRKFFGWYIKFIRDAAKYRSTLMQEDDFESVKRIINQIKESVNH